jgi:[ribosomal protein S5]-alanine N-acetyltransferase
VTTLVTARLLLLPLTRAVMTTRLARERFTLGCQTPVGPRTVLFPAQWPGAALAMFPRLLAELPDEAGGPARDHASVADTFTVVERATCEAIGLLGSKSGVDDRGVVEIGYGINPSGWGRGFATEAVGALTLHLFALPGVACVTAQTAADNLASQRVLEKNGFGRVGSSWSDDDGELLVWAVRGSEGASSDLA